MVAAFSRASDAVAAALEAQRSLARQVWPDGAELRVRIALHTAEAQLRDEGNYFGVALNRCARLRAIANGGQTLLSRAVYDLVVDRLPDGVELVDLGMHRLRDLGRPEHVFAISHPDLPESALPLRSLDALPNNLPEQLTSFVGRERELKEIRGALGATRMLTLIGAGGCGKTRLAGQVAADLLESFPTAAGGSSWRRWPIRMQSGRRWPMRLRCGRSRVRPRSTLRSDASWTLRRWSYLTTASTCSMRARTRLRLCCADATR